MKDMPAGLRTIEPLLDRLLEVIDDVVIVLDSTGQIVRMNEAGKRRARSGQDDSVPRKKWQDLWDAEGAQTVRDAFDRALAEGAVSIEIQTALRGEEKHWWKIDLSHIPATERGANGFVLAVLRDISAQKDHDETLRASRQLFDSAFDQSVMGLVLTDLDGRITSANEAFCRLVGYSEEELEGRTSAGFTHPDDLQNNAEAIRLVTSGEADISGFEKRYIRKDGRTVWTRVSLSLVKANGRDSNLIATVEDITEQKHSQYALRESEERLRLVFESVTDYAIFTLDPEGRVTEWNSGAERTFGYSAAEIIGRSGDVLWLPEDAERGIPQREREQALAVGMADDERWHRRKDGTRFFASGTTRPMRTANGDLQGFSKVCRDVTAQRAAERELDEARREIARATENERSRLAEIFKQSPSFMAVLRGPEHRFELVNDNYRRLVGYREIIGKTVREALPEVVSQGFVSLLDRVYQQGEEFVGKDVRVLIQHRAGEPLATRTVDFVYRPMRNARGDVDGIFVHGNDITERKLAEQESVRLAEQRHLALGAANMGWWQFDLATGLVHGDERYRAIFGIEDPAAPYEHVINCIDPADRQRVDEAVRAAIRPDDPEPYSIEYRISLPDGGVRWVRANGQTYYEGEGAQLRAVSFVGTVADITESKLAEDAMRESEARFRQLADAMPQIVFQAQPDGHVDYFNRQWYEYTGLPPGSVGFEHWRHVHDPEALPRVNEVWSAALRTGSPYQIEYRLRRADGEFRWHLGRALPVKDAEGNVIRWYGTNTDIHEQKQLQEQNESLLESERAARNDAERASRMKDEFLATLSHELRTPLNAILGWASILRAEPSPEDVAQGVEVIERNARAQTQIIADLLDMSRIISGKVRLEIHEIDLAATVRAAIDTVQPGAGVKGIRIQTAFDSLPHRMLGDAGRMQQVFWNLLTNAVKFTPRDGTVQVGLRVVHSHVEVSVQDSGEGIKPEFLPYVFDRFRQADASTTRRHGGLGLGLAIVRQLVELHGGTVRASSPGVGQGSTFTVALPIAPIQYGNDEPDGRAGGRKSAESTRIVPINLTGVRVLIVDDEPDARAMVARLLEGCDAEVRSASSAQEAIRLIREEIPDLLISDIGMPQEDGYSLIKRVRTFDPDAGGKVPAIALTAYARPEDRMKAILAGFQFHITKPVEAAELLAIVAGLVGQARES